MKIADIRKIVQKRWFFDQQSYPDMADMRSHEAAGRFARGHILKHMLKSIGRMAAIEEDADHGEPVVDIDNTREVMRDLIAKMMMNLMQLADRYGISDKEIEQAIRRKPEQPG